MSSIRSLVGLLLWEQLARNFAVRSRRAMGWLLTLLFFAVIVGPALQISLTIRDLLSGHVKDWIPTFYSWLTVLGSATLFLLSSATTSSEFTRRKSRGEEQIWRYLHPSRAGLAKLVMLVRGQLIPLAVLFIFALAETFPFLFGQVPLTRQNALIGADALITLMTAFLAGGCLPLT